MKRKEMTWEEHINVGNSIHAFRDVILKLRSDVVAAYGKTSKAHRKVMKVYNAIDELKCEMDSRVCDENPEKEEATKVYYGGLS